MASEYTELLFAFENVFRGLMRVLDIDMDFFQTDIIYDKMDSDGFLKGDNISIWEAGKIQYFLEERCGLDSNHKIKSKIITLIEVPHIDAHSDLAHSPNVKHYLS